MDVEEAADEANRMTTPINIGNYATKFEVYPPDLVEFAIGNNIQLPSLDSQRGQALALLSQPEVRGQKYVDGRVHATKFFNMIGMLDPTIDPIQAFNKGFGLKEIKKRAKYCLHYPFECDTTDIVKRKGVSISEDKNTYVNRLKDWFKKYILDVPNDEWQIGHLDPTIDDASEKNLAYQPPIQGKFRDRFKFDESFLKMWPTAEKELIPNFDKYYTDKEQRLMYEALKKKFETK